MKHKRWEKAERISAIVERKYGLRLEHCKSRSQLVKRYGSKLFELVNECYAPLYGYTPLTEKQIEQFIKMYIPVIDLRLISLVVDADDNLIALGVSIYSLAEALREAKGKLFPFGWWYLLKSMFWKKPDSLDLLLIGVRPDYQKRGVPTMLFTDLIKTYNKLGFRYAETNACLESNTKVRALWEPFENEQHKKRWIFGKEF